MDKDPHSHTETTGRTVKRPGPAAPVLIPDWGGLGSRTFSKTSADYFDSDGKPIIASAREIAPDADNPLWPWQRLGAAIFWRSARLERSFPRNVRNNPLLFYFTGRIRDRWWEDFVAFLPWLPLVALDGLLGFLAVRALLDPLFLNSFVGIFFSLVFVQVIFLMPIVGLLGQATVLFHLSGMKNRIPFDELALSRLTSEEILYGLMIKPVSSLHAANVLLLALSVFGVLAIAVASALLLPSMIFQAWLNVLLLPLLVLALLFRWIIFAASIDIGAATAVRAFLFLRETRDRVRRAAWDWLRVGGGFPVLSPAAALFLMTMFILSIPYGCVFSCVVLVVIGLVSMVWLRYVREIPIYAGNILAQTALHAPLWWVRTGEDIAADHAVFSD